MIIIIKKTERDLSMKHFIRLLQSPYIKMFVAPLAPILFGLGMGLHQSQNIQWPSMLWLVLISISAHLIIHYFHIRYDQGKQVSVSILYICEAVLVLAFIMLALSSHWTIILLLLLYLIYIHILYFPYNIADSIYGFILTVFYDGLILNIIAYYSQVSGLNQDFIKSLLPLLIFYLGSQYLVLELKSILAKRKFKLNIPQGKWLALAVMAAGIIYGFYQSLPSQFYYLVQAIYLVINGFIILTLALPVRQSHQIQNKINYLSASELIFVFTYLLASLYWSTIKDKNQKNKAYKRIWWPCYNLLTYF